MNGLREAAHEVGFFYLTGHGVPGGSPAGCSRRRAGCSALPQPDKDAVAMVRSPHFRGYTRLGGELTRGEVDWREQVDIGPRAPADRRARQARLPVASGPQPVAGRAAGAARDHRRVGRRAIRGGPHACCGTGRPRWAARRTCSTPPSPDAPATLIKVIRATPPARPPRRAWARTKDSGVLTLLLAEPGGQGLQVRRPERSCGLTGWVDVPPLDGAFVVNIGELLEVATGGYLQATEHRVDLRGIRGRADLGAVLLQSAAGRADSGAVAAGRAGGTRSRVRTDPSDPIFSVYGRNAWKSRLRAHPDVAAAHGHIDGRVGSGARMPILGSRGRMRSGELEPQADTVLTA